MNKRLTLLLLMLPCVLSLGSVKAMALSETKEPEAKVDALVVTGTISAVSKQGIAVEYSRTAKESHEMFLPLGEHVRLQRVRSLTELMPGDTVKVTYQQTYREGEKGERIVLKTAATDIAFMKRAVPLKAQEASE